MLRADAPSLRVLPHLLCHLERFFHPCDQLVAGNTHVSSSGMGFCTKPGIKCWVQAGSIPALRRLITRIALLLIIQYLAVINKRLIVIFSFNGHNFPETSEQFTQQMRGRVRVWTPAFCLKNS